jgi:hypothetical protein
VEAFDEVFEILEEEKSPDFWDISLFYWDA